MINITTNKIDATHPVSNESVKEGDSQIYELAREEQIFSSNEAAKLQVAAELLLQGITIEAISRVLSIPQDELIAEFEQL